MSRILVIGRDNPLSLEIGNALGKWNFPMDAAGDVDTLHRLRMKSFGVVISSPQAQLTKTWPRAKKCAAIRPGVKTIVLAPASTAAELLHRPPRLRSNTREGDS